MKMRVLLCLALLGSAMGQGGRNRNRNRDSNNNDDSAFDGRDSMDANYCCMSKHRPKIANKLAEYLDSASEDGDTQRVQWMEDLTKRYQDFHCTLRNGWSYCCPDGGIPQVFGNALCACQVFKSTNSIDDSQGHPLTPSRWQLGDSWDDSLEVKKQDCDSVDDWMADVIKARFGHGNDSSWTPPSGTCLESEKDECGCCKNEAFGWDSDDYTCEYGEDTDRGDIRFCKAFDLDFRPDSHDDHLVSDDLLDECGCLQNWGWDSDENACVAGGETTGITEIQLCRTFFENSSWDSWEGPVRTGRPHWGLDDSDDFRNPIGPIDLTGDDSRDGPRPTGTRVTSRPVTNDSDDGRFTSGPVVTPTRPRVTSRPVVNDSDDGRFTSGPVITPTRPRFTSGPVVVDSSDDTWTPGTRVTSRPVWTSGPAVPNDSDDNRWGGRRRLLKNARRLQGTDNNSFDGVLNFERDECGCIIGRQGFHNGKCRNNAGRGDSHDGRNNNLDSRDGRGNRRDRDSRDERENIGTYVTDYQDIMFCRAMKNRVCTEGKKDACGCCEFWGWDRVSRTCRPGSKTNKRDERRCSGDDDSKDDLWGGR